jgi:hypothetical protein
VKHAATPSIKRGARIRERFHMMNNREHTYYPVSTSMIYKGQKTLYSSCHPEGWRGNKRTRGVPDTSCKQIRRTCMTVTEGSSQGSSSWIAGCNLRTTVLHSRVSRPPGIQNLNSLKNDTVLYHASCVKETYTARARAQRLPSVPLSSEHSRPQATVRPTI